ncbi:MAG: 3-deoxy-D-manno-octulosonic acid transferase [Synergistaceae bacterium]|jgi:3-deoxy-D-manno-octulosonic-acid transferase|nr:3-deoxy-D-manno-octulosonic acid transferase [Synergistaceae bacterium]
MGLLLSAYRLAAGLAFPLIRGRLLKSHRTGFDERCGAYDQAKLDGIAGRKTLWLHAVSVGEVQAAAPFAREAASGWDGAIVMSTVTETGEASARSLVGDLIEFHAYAPWDIPRIVRAACDALHPSAYVTAETEVWPNLLTELRGRGVPTVLLNARLSDRTWNRAGIARGALREAYGLFDLILARGEEDGRRFEVLGADPGAIHVTGDCKVDAIIQRREAASEKIPALLEKLSRGFSGRASFFVAGSTHEGEDEAVIAAFREFRREAPPAGSMLIVAPRHPERAEAVAAMAGSQFRVAMFSSLTNRDSPEPPDIVIVDEIGALYDLYGVADAAFVGGSLVPKGGQNILEPASWGTPILHGPHMEDFAAPTAELDSLGAAHEVKCASEIASLWRKAALGELRPSAAAGRDYLASRSGAARRSWELVLPLLGKTND